MEFNVKKCHVLKLGKSMRTYRTGNKILEEKRDEKELGVIMQDVLSPESISTL